MVERAHTPLRVAFRRPWPGTLRGFAMWLLGLALLVLGGINYSFTDPPPTTVQSLQFVLQFTDDSTAPWGAVMALVGAFTVFCSYCHHNRDQIGARVFSVFCFLWGAVYVTGPLYGAGLRAIGLSVIWLLFSALALIISMFPNVPLRRRG